MSFQNSKGILRNLYIKYYIMYMAFIIVNQFGGGRRYQSWLWHCATSRKGTNSTPDEAINFFQFP
jgi:hypothetical protein